MRAYLTPRQYAEKYHVHINSVRKWIRRGWIPSAYIRRGRRCRYMIPAAAPPPIRKPGPPKTADASMRETTKFLLRLARLLRSQADILDDAGLLPNPRSRRKDDTQ